MRLNGVVWAGASVLWGVFYFLASGNIPASATLMLAIFWSGWATEAA
jgi:hypothetical protein